MNVSPTFSPPIPLMKPYFTLSGLFYLLSMLTLFFIDPKISLQDFSLIGWVHLYMLGFVMMGIFSAMAQLAPIVVETSHYSIKIFRYLHLFLVSGLAFMLYGFYIETSFLLYGGSLVFLAMLIYAIEFLLTLKNAQRKTSITKAMKLSNFFLLLGIFTGLIMAASFNSLLNINPQIILPMHTFGLIVGFVILLIMGISIILIPMFGSSARISDNEFSKSFIAIALGVIVMMFAPFFYTEVLTNTAYALVSTAILLYLYQLYTMTSSRKRVIHDIWALHMYVAFGSFIIAFILLCCYLLTDLEILLKLGAFLLLLGFFGFIILGNLYKIIPFLVWFHIYSPHIEERVVPMLHELLPKRVAYLQLFYSLLGLLIASLGIVLESTIFFKGGAILLALGALLFLLAINKILKAKI